MLAAKTCVGSFPGQTQELLPLDEDGIFVRELPQAPPCVQPAQRGSIQHQAATGLNSVCCANVARAVSGRRGMATYSLFCHRVT